MRTEFIPTNEIYRQILAAPDPATRRQIYLEQLVKPWKSMMDMLGMHKVPGADPDDELAGARAWVWLLPDQIELMAELLEKLEAADAWRVGQEAMEQTARCFAPWAGRIPFDTVSGWLVLSDPQRANPLERGYSGATDWMQPRFIGQFSDPNPTNLPRLAGLAAHEMHHLIRLRLFPWGPHTSVADYIVIEGTAEAFAASLFGEDKVTFFVSEFSEADLETARQLIGQGLSATGFDVVRGYMFGDALAKQYNFQAVGGMPTYAGYAVGYRVVKAFLERTGISIEEATFLPAAEIVEGSGYFA